ncbi:MAG TPA: DegT/DnrJ/EryC1/StrS family aminotransferase, partial [Candidatus Glassbacteria bacterium]|nr:DegT/DnrJ/EryC1/StrS family aminotransferase [Candidatus Glassbacteria bacterium]
GMSVLVPAFTFFSTGCSVMRSGAHVVFVDIEPRTFNMSATSAKEALRKQPAGLVAKAMITVHLYGQCADMRGLLDLARRHGLQVVEDAAQAILASHGGRAAGSFGACGCFSFYPTKNLGGFGDGGMITTNDAELAERLRLLRNHGSQDKVTYTSLGMNSRLDTLQAAVLLVKLRHLEEWTRLRQQKAATYRQAFLEAGLSNAEAVYPTREEPIVLPYVAPGAEHVYHQFTVRAWRRDELAKDLSAHGIETAIYYPVPLHQQPAFAALKAAQSALPESERAAKEVLSLPIYPELTEGQQDRVVRQIRKFYFS